MCVCRSDGHTRFVEETPELVLHIRLPLLQILLLGSAMSTRSQRSSHRKEPLNATLRKRPVPALTCTPAQLLCALKGVSHG